MITRIVKLTFKKELIPAFIEKFNAVKEDIRAFPGCQELEILSEVSDTGVIFTISRWSDEASLHRYRDSDLFGATWPEVKSMFSDKPHAWSLTDLEEID